MQPYVALPITSHKFPMAFLACIPIIPYRPLRLALAGGPMQRFKVKPLTAPPTLPMGGKIYCLFALQLKQVNTSVMTEYLIVVRDQIDH